MSTTEQRLAEALRARAAQVVPERLTPATPPVTVARPRWRRPAMYAAAVAACAAAIAAPFVLSGGPDREPGPFGPSPTSGSPSPTDLPTGASSPPATSAPPRVRDGFAAGSSPFADRTDQVIDLEGSGTEFTADLDGGGDETIRLSTPGDTARLSVTFDDGTTSQVDLDRVRPQSADPASIPSVHVVPLGSGTRRQLVVRWGGLNGVPEVFDVTGHQLRALAFTSYFGQNQAGEGGGSVWSVLTRDGSFYALRQTDAVAVDVFRWQVHYADGRPAYLVLGNEGKALGTWCKEETRGGYTPC